MNHRLRCRWPLAIILLWLPGALPAYTVEPNLLVLAPGGAESSAFLRLTNRTLKPAAVELVINEFGRDIEGRPILGRRVEDEFIVYPSQLVLMPGDEAGIQVRWIGAAVPDVERAFALTTREVAIPLPVSDPPEAAPDQQGARISVNVLVNYDVRIYVRPRGAKPRVTVEHVSVQQRSAPEPDLLEITLANLGTAHQQLRGLALVMMALDADGSPLRLPSVTVAAREVPGMSAALLAGDRRRLRVPRPAGLPGGAVRVTLTQ